MTTLAGTDTPYVFTPHGKLSPSMYGNYRLIKRLWWKIWTKKVVGDAEKIVLLNPGESELFDQLGLPNSWEVIPNGFQMPEAFNQGQSLGDGLVQEPIDEPYILFLGYLDPRKQPELLVKAFARSESRNTHRLVIVGPDAYGHKPSIQRTIRQSGVENKVDLHGPAYGVEKWNLFFGATCMALPSKGEGSPVTIFEALGAGTPVIASAQCNRRRSVYPRFV
jgi:glycosyltransferase involved in cell wall biosynthesis